MSASLPPPEVTLSEDDRHTVLWLRLKAHLTEKLDAARAENDRLQPEPETAFLRGRIKALKRILALGDPSPIEADT